ncbi:MAG: UMP kinase [Candidatus Aenigmarchaeota archaeon]|nr:UMP kinase [Candidatus Aenigmarchaeota archaeon]
MKVAIRIGGSLLTRKLDTRNFKKYVDVLRKLKRDGHKLLVVTGGGSTSRIYQNIARSLGADGVSTDWVGIAATKLTAMTLVAALGKKAFPVVLTNLRRIKREFGRKILVCGAFEPGHSTDYDLALYAHVVGADLIIKATNVDGVYSADPKKNRNAKKFSRLTYNQFLKIMSKNEQTPGKYKLFDLRAAQSLKRWKIRTIILDGKKPSEILSAVKGKHHGTVIE